MIDLRIHNPVAGQRCWCGSHHYQCDECGADCTMGAQGGPATTDSRGVTRCRDCQHGWECLRSMSPWTRLEAETIRVALARVADDGDPDPVTDE